MAAGAAGTIGADGATGATGPVGEVESLGKKRPPSCRPDSASLRGRLELVAAPDATGRTGIVRQFHSVPFHLSKPYWDGRVLLAQIANPTAGIFEGDRMECQVEAREKASLLVTSPSAARAHTMGADGRGALLEQRFRVARGAWLEVFPEVFIPQRAADFRQRTEIEVEEGGSLCFAEVLALGRIAHGETLAFRRLDWSFALRVAGELVAVERVELSPPGDAWMLRVEGWEHAHYAGVWLAGPGLGDLREDLCRRIDGFGDGDSAFCGITRAGECCHAVKILAASSIVLRRILTKLRAEMSGLLPGLASSLRKL